MMPGIVAASTATAATAADHKVLLGVMTAPQNTRLRTQWRNWRALFNASGFDVRFVLGREFYQHASARPGKQHDAPQQ